MQRVIQQLEQVRRLGRLLLLVQHLTRWCAALLLVGLLCAVVDYALRLPWWLRLAIGLLVAVAGLVWLARRVRSVARFRPTLGALAQRAERLFPQLSGTLASAVEFTADAQTYAHPGRTAALASATIDRARALVWGVRFRKLIAPARTVRWLLVAVASCAIVGAVAAASPSENVYLALRRWFMPVGAPPWPTRQRIESLVTQRVAPTEQPLKLAAHVVKGHSPGLRAWVYHRIVGPGDTTSAWQSHLMSERAAALSAGSAVLYERLLDLSETAILLTGTIKGDRPRVEFYFESGDHRGPLQSVQLVQRPEVRDVSVSLEPPPYAQGIVEPRKIQLAAPDQLDAQIATAASLQGSHVQFVVRINKPIPSAATSLAQVFPGFGDVPDIQASARVDDESRGADSASHTIALAFRLDRTMQTPIQITDEFGLHNMSERLYRLRAVEDGPPQASVLKPASDESVLATAQVFLSAVARDDVALQTVTLEAEVPTRHQADAEAIVEHQVLSSESARLERITVEHDLDLRSLPLLAGDVVIVRAVAQDIFDLDGRRHDPVVSSPRKLLIIEPAELVRQMRTQIGGVRQQAIRIDARQLHVQRDQTPAARPGQRQVTRHLANQRAVLDAVSRRIDSNRLDAPMLTELVEHAEAMLMEAAESSQAAEQHLNDAQENEKQEQATAAARQAAQEQDKVRGALEQLINLLDQGKDVLTLQLRLKQLEADQRGLADETRRMLPLTAARQPDQLQQDEADQLGQLAEQQSSLGQQSRALVERMQAAADALAAQSQSPRDQAAATALAAAAAIAQRQGLTGGMKEAGEQVRENRLAAAGAQQQNNLQVLQQMLEQLNDQQRRREEILRRHLADLAESLGRLIAQQTLQLERLQNAPRLSRLVAALEMLRINTLAVAEQARRAEKTQPVAEVIAEAANYQGEALAALRQDQREPATAAEESALERLSEALRQVQILRDSIESDKTRQERDELRQAYVKLARQQEGLREQTVPLADVVPLDRRQKMALFNIGDEQADVRVETGKLQNNVSDTKLFKHLHDRIDDLAGRAASALRIAQPSQRLLADQRRIAVSFRRMSEALEQDQDQDQFDSGSGGGGGGGGAGGRPQVVTSLAELKLLSGLQQDLYDRTKTLDAQVPHGPGHEAALRALGDEQAELVEMGELLVKQFEAGMRGLEQRREGGDGRAGPEGPEGLDDLIDRVPRPAGP